MYGFLAVDEVVVSQGNNMDNPVYGVCDVVTQPAVTTVTNSPGYDFDNPLYDVSEPLPLPVEPHPPPAAMYETIENGMTSGSYATIGEHENGLTTNGQISNLYDVVNLR